MADIVTGNEFLRMQNDAINRVRQMQQRADSFIPPAPQRAAPPAQQKAKPPAPLAGQASKSAAPLSANGQHHQHAVQGPQNNPGGMLSGLLGGGSGMLGGLLGGKNGIGGILDNIFNGETDKLLILGMVWLLSKENADQMLIMALLYILM